MGILSVVRDISIRNISNMSADMRVSSRTGSNVYNLSTLVSHSGRSDLKTDELTCEVRQKKTKLVE